VVPDPLTEETVQPLQLKVVVATPVTASEKMPWKETACEEVTALSAMAGLTELMVVAVGRVISVSKDQSRLTG
jgi:hypothetical protein